MLSVHLLRKLKRIRWLFADAFRMQYDEQDPFYGRIVVQKHGDRYLVQNTRIATYAGGNGWRI